MFAGRIGKENQKLFFHLAYFVAVAEPVNNENVANDSNEIIFRLEKNELDIIRAFCLEFSTCCSDILTQERPCFSQDTIDIDYEFVNFFSSSELHLGGNISERLYKYKDINGDLGSLITYRNIEQIPKKIIDKISEERESIDIIGKIKSMLSESAEDSENLRKTILGIAIYAVTQNVKHLDIDRRKAILFELVTMAYADGSCTKYERFALEVICQRFGVDVETLDEFNQFVQKYKILYKEIVDIITE